MRVYRDFYFLLREMKCGQHFSDFFLTHLSLVLLKWPITKLPITD